MRNHRFKSITLIELLIATSLFIFIGMILLVFTRNGYSIFQTSQVTNDISSESNTLTSRITSAIRGTFSVIAATDTNLVVLSYFAPTDVTPTQVTITKSGNNVVLTTIQGVVAGNTYNYDPALSLTRVISSHFSTSPAVPLFSYYNEMGVQLHAPIDLTAVHLIQVTSSIVSAVDPSSSTSSTTKVELRNLKTNL